MSYYRVCPNCGANLDPSETCDCEKQPAMEAKEPIIAKGRPHMLTGIDLARGADHTVPTAMVTAGGTDYPLHRCVNCAWYGRGGDDCDNPDGGASCKQFAPNAETLEQAQILAGKLQMAYLLHLTNRLNKRLPWLESTIDQLHQCIGNRRL